MDFFYLSLGIALLLGGVSVFVPERVLQVIAAIAAIVAGAVALARL